MNVLLLYYTKTGHTLEAIDAVCQGIRLAGSHADLIAVDNFATNELANYDALIVGSPCWHGAMGGLGVAKPMIQALEGLALESLTGKRCGGISVHASQGGDKTIKTLGTILKHKGCEVYIPGPVATAGTTMSIIKGPSVTCKDIKLLKVFGTEFVQCVKNDS